MQTPIHNLVQSEKLARFLVVIGLLSPLWLFLFNFSRNIISHKAALPVEVYIVSEKGKELANLCRISPTNKVDSFYQVKANYFTREDEWGQGKGYIKTISFKAAEIDHIRMLFLRCGEKIYSWRKERIVAEWNKENDSFILTGLPGEELPFYGRVMNYAGNASVARAVFLPTLLMSLVLVTLAIAFYSLHKTFQSARSLTQNANTILFQTKQGKWFTWTCITSIVIFYLYNYLTLPPYIHAETYMTFPRLANNSSEGFFDHLFEKSFDLGRVEEGGYRPRALAFLIGYTDTNLMILLNEKFPGFGARLPLMLVAAFLLVFAFYRLTRTLLPKIPIEAALLIGCSMLFFQNFQATTYLYLRSAKALCPAVCVLLLDLYFRYRNTQTGKPISIGQAFLYSLLIFVSCTLDEQVIAVVLLVLLLSVISAIREKRAGLILYASAGALFLYAVFYQLANSLLFERYTPLGLHAHDHSFSDPLFSFGLESIERAGEIWMHLALALGASWILLVPAVVLTSFLWMQLSKADKTTSAILFAFSLLLIMGVIGSHRTAYFCKELWNGAYFLPAACLMLAGVLFVWGRGFSETGTTRGAVVITFFFLAAVLINTLRIDIFYNNYTSVEARERGAIVDARDWMSPENAKFFGDARKPALQLETWLNSPERAY